MGQSERFQDKTCTCKEPGLKQHLLGLSNHSHDFAHLRHLHFRPPGSAGYFCVWCSWSKSTPKKKGLSQQIRRACFNASMHGHQLPPLATKKTNLLLAFLMHETWQRRWLVGYSADKWQTSLAFFCFLRCNPAGCTCQRMLWVLLFVFHFGWSSHIVPSTGFFKGKMLPHINNRHPAAIHKGSCIIRKKGCSLFLVPCVPLFLQPSANHWHHQHAIWYLASTAEQPPVKTFHQKCPYTARKTPHLLPRLLIFGKRTRHRRSACPMSRSKTANLRAKVSSTIEGYQKTLKDSFFFLKIRDL